MKSWPTSYSSLLKNDDCSIKKKQKLMMMNIIKIKHTHNNIY